jgi:hypothetical protein
MKTLQILKDHADKNNLILNYYGIISSKIINGVSFDERN